MNKTKWMVGIFCLSAMAMSWGAAFPASQEDLAKQVQDLKKQVATLEEKVASLESRLQKITLAIPQTFPELKQLPKGWEKREFNGMSYYIIPLDQDLKKAKPAIR
jgi:outer membrane murein-binding lipoprotein Lpp